MKNMKTFPKASVVVGDIFWAGPYIIHQRITRFENLKSTNWTHIEYLTYKCYILYDLQYVTFDLLIRIWNRVSLKGYVLSKLVTWLFKVCLMLIINDKMTISILKNLKLMENTENSRKTRILGSFLYAVFTYTVLHGEDRLNMKEGVELDWFLLIRSFQAVPKVTKNTKPRFLKIDYVIMTSRDDFS